MTPSWVVQLPHLKDGIHPEGPGSRSEFLGISWGLTRPRSRAAPGSEQPQISAQAEGWTAQEETCPEGTWECFWIRGWTWPAVCACSQESQALLGEQGKFSRHFMSWLLLWQNLTFAVRRDAEQILLCGVVGATYTILSTLVPCKGWCSRQEGPRKKHLQLHDVWGKQNSEERGLGTQQSVDFHNYVKHRTWACCMQHTPTLQQDKQYSLPCPKLFSWEANVAVQLGLEPESSPTFQAGSSTARMDSPWSCLSQGWTPRATAALKGTPNVISLMVKLCMRNQVPGKHLTCSAYRQQVLLHGIYSN